MEGHDRVVELGGHGLPLTDYNAVLVNPWEEHAMPAQPARAAGPRSRTLLLSIYLDRGWLASLAGSPRAHIAFDHSSVDLADGTRSIVASLADAVLDTNDATGENLEHLVRRLASDLLLLKPATHGVGGVEHMRRAPAWDAKIRRAVAYMEAHVQSGLNVSHVAGRTGRTSCADFFVACPEIASSGRPRRG